MPPYNGSDGMGATIRLYGRKALFSFKGSAEVTFGNAYLCDGNRVDGSTKGNQFWLIEARISGYLLKGSCFALHVTIYEE